MAARVDMGRMDVPRRLHRGPSRAVMLGAAAMALAGSLVALGERGAFSDAVGHPVPALPGVTLEDGAGAAAMPIVTSLRSDGQAERSGLRVGDRIAALDGQPVGNVAALDRAMRARAAKTPLRLHIRRGDTVWTLAIDRAETDHRGKEPHDPQDSAG
jgi:S1-C subfamily serine protease